MLACGASQCERARAIGALRCRLGLRACLAARVPVSGSGPAQPGAAASLRVTEPESECTQPQPRPHGRGATTAGPRAAVINSPHERSVAPPRPFTLEVGTKLGGVAGRARWWFAFKLIQTAIPN
jgi:hypothetical protein